MGSGDARRTEPADGGGSAAATADGGGAAAVPAEAVGRGGYLGFVAHEIRNPLSTALWTAELLARLAPEDRGGPRGEKLSAMCLRSISRVRQLIEDHFLCERLDAGGGLILRVEAVGVREAVDAVLERRPPDAGPVDLELDPALVVEVDRSMLERALESLLAVAGAEKARVKVTARPAEGEVALALMISGRPADAAGLADPVKGAPSDPTGRALALPAARRIAEVLGGVLAAVDGGWCLTLPRARSAGPRPTPAEP